jgi:hypothetical protein
MRPDLHALEDESSMPNFYNAMKIKVDGHQNL